MKKSGLNVINNLIAYLYCIFSFGILDAWLRVVTRWIGQYSIYEMAPNLFTLCWSIFLSVIILSIPKKRFRCIIYAVSYFFWMVYAIIQYGSYLILDKFLFLSDFMYTGEGTDYITYILEFLNTKFNVQIVILVVIGVIGIALVLRDDIKRTKKSTLVNIEVGLICIGAIGNTPRLYGQVENSWANFTNPAYEYDQFNNSCFDMELTGMYQFVARDLELKFEKVNKDYISTYKEIDNYFESKKEYSQNNMTGLFEGKNIILVMMESMDDWLIQNKIHQLSII